MRAIILAAGVGSRLREIAGDMPKCLVSVRGQSIIGRQIKLLNLHGVSDIHVVVGHRPELMKSELEDAVAYHYYADYSKTNNLHTLHSARDLLDRDTIVLFADVLLEREALARLIGGQRDFELMVDTSQSLENTMRVKLENGLITDIGSHIPAPDGDGNFVGIAKFSETGAKLLHVELERMVEECAWKDAYYIATLPRLENSGQSMGATDIAGIKWLEIDTPDEYHQAENADFYLFDDE